MATVDYVICSTYNALWIFKNISLYYNLWRKIVHGVFKWYYSVTKIVKLIWISKVNLCLLFVEFEAQSIKTLKKSYKSVRVYKDLWGKIVRNAYL